VQVSRRLRMIFSLSLLGLLLGCPRRVELTLVGQAEPGRPIFGVTPVRRGEPNYLGVLIVAPCAGFDGTARSALWFIVGDAPIERVEYGRVPVGYSAQGYMTGPLTNQGELAPLTAGCYIARTDGTGSVTFEVRPDGTVLATPEGQESRDAT
jgi:hypothetical protein